MQINFDPRDLNDAERVHLANFILGWPAFNRASPNVEPTVELEWPAAHLTSPQSYGNAPQSEPAILANENAADLQPLDAADDNTDKAAAEAAFTPSATPDRDGEGLPWDRRIHSSSKALNADGRWRIARNVAPELIESVKSELRALVAAPVADAVGPEEAAFDANVSAQPSAYAPPPPPAAVSVNELAPMPVPDAVVAFNGIESVINVDALAVAPPPPPVAAGDTPAPDLNVMFTTLLRDAGQAVVAQRITSAELTAICVKHGVANVGLLASRKDLVPQIDADFRAVLSAKVQP